MPKLFVLFIIRCIFLWICISLNMSNHLSSNYQLFYFGAMNQFPTSSHFHMSTLHIKPGIWIQCIRFIINEHQFALSFKFIRTFRTIWNHKIITCGRGLEVYVASYLRYNIAKFYIDIKLLFWFQRKRFIATFVCSIIGYNLEKEIVHSIRSHLSSPDFRWSDHNKQYKQNGRMNFHRI